MNKLPQALQTLLQQRQDAKAVRRLPEPLHRIDLSSNDYLGFARDPALFVQAHGYLAEQHVKSNGATGSRLITGNYRLYENAEELISRFHRAEAALVFNSGYDANVGVFSSIPQKRDVVLYDEYVHASIRDGIRLSNARAFKFRHNDLHHLEKLILKHKQEGAEVYVATETIFSMDGDSPDLSGLVELAKKHGCHLIVDEAHALGVAGEEGEGMVQALGLEEEVFIRVMTFGKGLGCHGAAVLGPAGVKQYLVNFARSFIYTTGLPPHALATICCAYKYLQSTGRERGRELHNLIIHFRNEVMRLGLGPQFTVSASAIQCAVIAGNENVKHIEAALHRAGFDVKAILSPTVPAGKERLRFCLHAYNTQQEVTAALATLQAALRE